MGVSAKFEGAFENRGAGTWAKAAIEERAAPIIDDPGRIEIVLRAETIAGGASAVRRIEAEGARLQLRNGDAAIGTGELFRKSMLLTTYDSHGYQPAGQFERGGDGLLEARGDARLDEQAVDDHFDGVVLALVDDREIVEREQLTVDAHENVAVLREFFEFLAKSALRAAHEGRMGHDADIRIAYVTGQDGLHELLSGLAGDG